MGVQIDLDSDLFANAIGAMRITVAPGLAATP